MAAGSGVVSQPDTVVLHAVGSVTLLDFLDLNDLTVSLLDFLKLRQEIPKSGFGDDVVWRKDGHAKERWVADLSSGDVSTHNSVLTKLEDCEKNNVSKWIQKRR